MYEGDDKNTERPCQTNYTTKYVDNVDNVKSCYLKTPRARILG